MPSKRKSSACVDYVPALCTHRPSLLPIEWLSEAFGLPQGGPATAFPRRKVRQTWSFRGSKSRNKVSVGEPAEGSLLRAYGLITPANPPILCLLSLCGLLGHKAVWDKKDYEPLMKGGGEWILLGLTHTQSIELPRRLPKLKFYNF